MRREREAHRRPASEPAASKQPDTGECQQYNVDAKAHNSHNSIETNKKSYHCTANQRADSEPFKESKERLFRFGASPVIDAIVVHQIFLLADWSGSEGVLTSGE